jgi:hypothetical protein
MLSKQVWNDGFIVVTNDNGILVVVVVMPMCTKNTYEWEKSREMGGKYDYKIGSSRP